MEKDVLIVHPSFESRGGGEKVALKIAEKYVTQNNDVTILTASEENVVKEAANKLGVDIRKIQIATFGVKILKNVPPGIKNVIFIRFFLEKALKKLGKFDIIWNNVGDFVYTPPFLKYSKEKTIFYVHFPLRALKKYSIYYGEFSFEIYIYDKLLSVLAEILENPKNIDRIEIFANSSFTASEFEKIYGVKPKVLNPIINVRDDFKYKGERKENIIVTVGRITPQKGHLRLLIAANKIKDILKSRKWKVVIVGAYTPDIFGIRRRYLRKMIEYVKKNELDDVVEIKINVSFNELTEILKKSKVYVHTMIGEHFGISAYEAKEAGCILILPEKSGAWTDIKYDKKYSYKDVDELAELLQKIIEKDNN